MRKLYGFSKVARQTIIEYSSGACKKPPLLPSVAEATGIEARAVNLKSERKKKVTEVTK